jgi:GDP-4-dehydro-6-deoxy-D-mannose reductase
MSTALITGSHGFAGRHLAAELRSRGYRVVGLGRTALPDQDYVVADLADDAAVTAALRAHRPDVVFHLAATATGPGQSILDNNVGAAHGLGKALRRVPARLVIAGSSAQYGLAPSPVTEDSRCEPVSAYGHAKAAAESILRGHAGDGGFADGGFEDGGFEVIPVRAFNHIGPGEPATTVSGAFADRIRSVLAGRTERVNVAGLDSVRDFTDVRDVVRGYADLGEQGVPGRVYNLCSGRPATIGDVLDALLAAAGLDRGVVDVTADPPGARSGQIGYQVGAADRVRQELGWTATIGLEQSTKDLLYVEAGS